MVTKLAKPRIHIPGGQWTAFSISRVSQHSLAPPQAPLSTGLSGAVSLRLARQSQTGTRNPRRHSQVVGVKLSDGADVYPGTGAPALHSQNFPGHATQPPGRSSLGSTRGEIRHADERLGAGTLVHYYAILAGTSCVRSAATFPVLPEFAKGEHLLPGNSGVNPEGRVVRKDSATGVRGDTVDGQQEKVESFGHRATATAADSARRGHRVHESQSPLQCSGNLLSPRKENEPARIVSNERVLPIL
jgi:hypothetical protein